MTPDPFVYSTPPFVLKPENVTLPVPIFKEFHLNDAFPSSLLLSLDGISPLPKVKLVPLVLVIVPSPS